MRNITDGLQKARERRVEWRQEKRLTPMDKKLIPKNAYFGRVEKVALA